MLTTMLPVLFTTALIDNAASADRAAAVDVADVITAVNFGRDRA